MRTLRNPYKDSDEGIDNGLHLVQSKTAKIPKKITVCMLAHVPNEVGYYSERLEILDITLKSLRKNTDSSLYDLFVLNNGSGKAASDYLQDCYDRGEIDYLLHAKDNLGVCNGMSILFSAAPGDYVCRVDDDVFFFEGWLEKTLAVLTTFPRTGTVTPCPNRSGFNKPYSDAYLKVYNDEDHIKFLEPQWDEEWDEFWCHGTGVNLKSFQDDNPLEGLQLLEVDGVRAYPMGHHFVSMVKKSTLNKILPFPFTSRVMGGGLDDETSLVNVFDKAINDLGLVKLTTNGRYVEHIGNKIDSRIKTLVEKYDLSGSDANTFLADDTGSLKFFDKLLVRFFKLPFIRRLPTFFVNYFGKVIYLKSLHRLHS